MFKGKVALVTGSTDGIGKATAMALAKNRAHVLLHGRDPEKGKRIVDEVQEYSGNSQVDYFNADFTSIHDIANFVTRLNENHQHLDILINNAGVYENQRIVLDNGLEKSFMVNYLAPFYLTLNLYPLLTNAYQAQVINISSMIHARHLDFNNMQGEKFYSASEAYSLTKLLNLLFTYKLTREWESENVLINALHPGVINTRLLRAGWAAMGSEPSDAAGRIIQIINVNEQNMGKGLYFENGKPVKSADVSYDIKMQDRLWMITQKLLNELM